MSTLCTAQVRVSKFKRNSENKYVMIKSVKRATPQTDYIEVNM